jgi:hypothetical protein
MRSPRLQLLAALGAAGLLVAAASAVVAEEDEEMEEGGLALAAAPATIAVDGDASDWEGIERTTVELEQIDLDEIPPEQAEEIDFGAVDPIDVQLAVANDADNIYILMEVPTPYDYVADDHGLSPALAVESPIESASSVHMGAEEEDLFVSTGMVDIWHWELDCGPGELSGGQGVAGGDDEACNLDDEYSTTPEMREDDGGGDDPNDAAENSLVGSWSHSAAEVGGDGTWVFEWSRPLSTGDPQDAQFEAGGTADLVLAWWDPRESSEGWSDAGHLTNAESGWIEVTLN